MSMKWVLEQRRVHFIHPWVDVAVVVVGIAFDGRVLVMMGEQLEDKTALFTGILVYVSGSKSAVNPRTENKGVEVQVIETDEVINVVLVVVGFELLVLILAELVAIVDCVQDDEVVVELLIEVEAWVVTDVEEVADVETPGPLTVTTGEAIARPQIAVNMMIEHFIFVSDDQF